MTYASRDSVCLLDGDHSIDAFPQGQLRILSLPDARLLVGLWISDTGS